MPILNREPSHAPRPLLSFLRTPKPVPVAAPARTAPVTATAPVPTVVSAERAAAEVAIIVEAVGGLLHAYAQHAFDTDLRSGDETRALVQQWRMHAVIGAAPPDVMGGAIGSSAIDRDWRGLLRFFGDTRRDEAAFVVRGQNNLRESIWAFVSGLHHLVLEEHEEGKLADEHIRRVKLAVEGNDTEALKKETMAAVSVMESLMSTRRARQQEEFSRLAEKLRNLGRELEDARREGCLDALTGLPNRKEFDAYVQKSIELHTITGRPACLLMVDVDQFKQINDTFGHPVGDEALKLVTRALSRTILRRVDFVCRFGGDEFAIILQETDAAGAWVLGEKLRRALRDVLATPRINERGLDFTLSVGAAELSVGDHALSWTTRADQALYKSKSLGRDRVELLTALE